MNTKTPENHVQISSMVYFYHQIPYNVSELSIKIQLKTTQKVENKINVKHLSHIN